MKLSAFSLIAAAFFAFVLLWSTSAFATKTVTSPYVTKGKLDVKWKGGVTHDDDNSEDDGAWEQAAEIAYGVTDRVQVELESKIKNKGDEDNTSLTVVKLESKAQLTERGQYWVDVGVKGEYEFNANDGADKVELKLVLAKNIGQFTHMANLNLEREVGSDSDDETEAGLAWGSRYRYNQYFEPGVELYSEFGPISDFNDTDDQEHLLGPVVYGKVGHMKYQVGYLAGLTDGSPDGLAKAVLEYEWHF